MVNDSKPERSPMFLGISDNDSPHLITSIFLTPFKEDNLLVEKCVSKAPGYIFTLFI